VLLKDMLLG